MNELKLFVNDLHFRNIGTDENNNFIIIDLELLTINTKIKYFHNLPLYLKNVEIFNKKFDDNKLFNKIYCIAIAEIILNMFEYDYNFNYLLNRNIRKIDFNNIEINELFSPDGSYSRNVAKPLHKIKYKWKGFFFKYILIKLFANDYNDIPTLNEILELIKTMNNKNVVITGKRFIKT
jgi:hypothetical protein